MGSTAPVLARFREIAEQAEIIHLCVTGSAQVEALIRGENGILAGLQPGAIVVDCSTSDPVSTLALAEELIAMDDKTARWIGRDAARELTSDAVNARLARTR